MKELEVLPPADRGLHTVAILPYDPAQWPALWQLRTAQLAENGILLSPEVIPVHAMNVGRDDFEWDYHHMQEIFLYGAGGFWLAWWDQEPVGHIGGQDLGDVIELRHMYVRAEYRRRGIGARLVQALIDHCSSQPVRAIELWTQAGGVGQRLYVRMGFRVTGGLGNEFADAAWRTNFNPSQDEVRMRLDL